MSYISRFSTQNKSYSTKEVTPLLSLNKAGLQEIVYDSERNDYFYKTSGERVPDKLRKGLNTTVFWQSSKRRLDDETEEDVQERHVRFENFKAQMKAKYSQK
jgi:hypothetical protein